MSDSSQTKGKTRRCLVCSNTNKSVKNVSYFRVPPDAALATQWFKNLKREDLTDFIGVQSFDNNSYICSEHFDSNSMYIQGSPQASVVQKRLRRNAVPIPLDFPIEQQQYDLNKTNGSTDTFENSLFDLLDQNMTSDENVTLSYNKDFDNEISSSILSNFEDDMTDYNLEMFEDLTAKELECYKDIYKSIDKIVETRVHCTSCNCHIGTAPINEAIVRMHPVLRVTQCKKCFTFYNSGEFEKGDDGSELYCRWCGQGGEVYCCSSCPYVFCRRCIVQNLSKSCVTDIQNTDNWNCFSCNPKIMMPLRAQHWALVNFMEKQKRGITKSSSNETQINQLMNNDLSTCCTTKPLKKIAPKRKPESSVIESIPPAKKPIKSFIPKLLNPSLPTSAGTQNEERVQCTPDILSMFNNQQESQTPSGQQGETISNGQSSNEAPPLRLIRRDAGAKDSGKATGQATTPIHVATATTTNPVYHTINGFRIDLNTAAQSETYRLPNGKLIQVKKQSPAVTTKTTTLPTQTTHTTTTTRTINVPPRTVQVNIRPSLQQNRQLPVTPVNQQKYQQQFQQHQQLQQDKQQKQQVLNAQYQHPPNVNQFRNIAPKILQTQLSQPTPPIVSSAQSKPPPLVIRTVASTSPISLARQQFEQRVDNSMEVCQHIIGKIRTLTFSSAYKNAQNLTDLKDLTIHLSYLMTYAIGRFKTLQEKCTEDMEKMIITENKAKAAEGDDDDDDIQIVETANTIIEIDSDNEEEVKTISPTKVLDKVKTTTTNIEKISDTNKNDKTPDILGEQVELLEVTDLEEQQNNELQTQVTSSDVSITKSNGDDVDKISETGETVDGKTSSENEKENLDQGLMEVDASDAEVVIDKVATENENNIIDTEPKNQDNSDKNSENTVNVILSETTGMMLDDEVENKESSGADIQDETNEDPPTTKNSNSSNEMNDDMDADSIVTVSVLINENETDNETKSDETPIPPQNQDEPDQEKLDSCENVNLIIETVNSVSSDNNNEANDNSASSNEKETVEDNPDSTENLCEKNDSDEDMSENSKVSDEIVEVICPTNDLDEDINQELITNQETEEANEAEVFEEITDNIPADSISGDGSNDSEIFDKETESVEQENIILDKEDEKMDFSEDNTVEEETNVNENTDNSKIDGDDQFNDMQEETIQSPYLTEEEISNDDKTKDTDESESTSNHQNENEPTETKIQENEENLKDQENEQKEISDYDPKPNDLITQINTDKTDMTLGEIKELLIETNTDTTENTNLNFLLTT